MSAVRLKWFQYALLLGLIGCGVAFTLAQKYFIPETVRPFTLILLLVVICFVFFHFVRPSDPKSLAKFLSIVFGGCALVLIVVIDIILKHTYSYKFIIVLAAALGSPYLGLLCYRATGKSARARSL